MSTLDASTVQILTAVTVSGSDIEAWCALLVRVGRTLAEESTINWDEPAVWLKAAESPGDDAPLPQTVLDEFLDFLGDQRSDDLRQQVDSMRLTTQILDLDTAGLQGEYDRICSSPQLTDSITGRRYRLVPSGVRWDGHDHTVPIGEHDWTIDSTVNVAYIVRDGKLVGHSYEDSAQHAESWRTPTPSDPTSVADLSWVTLPQRSALASLPGVDDTWPAWLTGQLDSAWPEWKQEAPEVLGPWLDRWLSTWTRAENSDSLDDVSIPAPTLGGESASRIDRLVAAEDARFAQVPEAIRLEWLGEVLDGTAGDHHDSP